MSEKYTNFFQSVFDNRTCQRSLIGKDAELQQLTFLAVYDTAFIYKTCKKSRNKVVQRLLIYSF